MAEVVNFHDQRAINFAMAEAKRKKIKGILKKGVFKVMLHE